MNEIHVNDFVEAMKDIANHKGWVCASLYLPNDSSIGAELGYVEWVHINDEEIYIKSDKTIVNISLKGITTITQIGERDIDYEVKYDNYCVMVITVGND